MADAISKDDEQYEVRVFEQPKRVQAGALLGQAKTTASEPEASEAANDATVSEETEALPL